MYEDFISIENVWEACRKYTISGKFKYIYKLWEIYNLWQILKCSASRIYDKFN